jgi:NADH-quinone oxidoreductase subunit G
MKMARQPHRSSGRTAMFANRTVFDPRPARDHDSPLAFTMEGYPGRPPSALITHFWYPQWNSAQAVNKFQEEVGGPLRGGDPGKRLIEAASATPRAFQTLPAAFAPEKGYWLLFPIHHIFGSEPLSSLAPGVAERAPLPYIALAPGSAREMALAEGDQVQVTANGRTFAGMVRILDGLPAGAAGVPAGIGDMPFPELPARAAIVKLSSGVTP